ncbi:MAG: hypothetical protein R3Y33_01795 [Clostridia bacterium]
MKVLRVILAVFLKLFDILGKIFLFPFRVVLFLAGLVMYFVATFGGIIMNLLALLFFVGGLISLPSETLSLYTKVGVLVLAFVCWIIPMIASALAGLLIGLSSFSFGPLDIGDGYDY